MSHGQTAQFMDPLTKAPVATARPGVPVRMGLLSLGF